MTVRQASAALALFIVLPISAWPQSLQSSEASLRVRVIDPDARVIPKARVLMRSAAGGQSIEADVNAEGIAQFQPPTQGSYVISAKAEGFTDGLQFVDWKHEPVTIEMRLEVDGLREQITVTSGSRVEELQQNSPVIGNPNLEPETSRSFSTGVDFRARRFRGSVSLFRNDVRNLIDSANIGTPRTGEQLAAVLTQYGIPFSFYPLLNRQTFIYQNFGRIYTRGFELDAEQSITRQLRVMGSYTYVDARDRNTRLGLPQRHKHQGFVRTEYANSRLGLLANVRGTFFSNWLLNPVAGTRALGYNLWDFYISKNLPHGTQAYFSIDNFTDSRDQKLSMPTPAFDRPDYGRLYRVGLRWRFGGTE